MHREIWEVAYNRLNGRRVLQQFHTKKAASHAIGQFRFDSKGELVNITSVSLIELYPLDNETNEPILERVEYFSLITDYRRSN
jgi:hypothetical protein